VAYSENITSYFAGSRRIDQIFGNYLNFLTVFSSWVVTLLHSSET
jgi:hypothetical protein